MTTFLFSLILAASGDVNCILKIDNVKLTAGQKTDLAAAITDAGAFPSANPATILMYYCSRLEENGKTVPKCEGTYTSSTTKSDFVNQEIAGEALAGDETNFIKKAPAKEITGAAITKLGTFVVGAFPGITVADVYDMRCWRDLEAPTEVYCFATYHDSVGPATYMTLRASGNVIRPISRVP